MDPYIAKLIGHKPPEPERELLKLYSKGQRTFIVIRSVLSSEGRKVLHANMERLRVTQEAHRLEEQRKQEYAQRTGGGVS